MEFVDGVTPLIVSLHGYAGDSVYHSTYLKLHERVNAHGFALLLPNALPDGTGYPAWNPTDQCCDGERAFYASAEDMVTRWSHRAGCDWPEQARPHARLDLDLSVPGPETQVFRPESGCAEGISIELWAGVDSGHRPSYGDAFMVALLDWLLSQT